MQQSTSKDLLKKLKIFYEKLENQKLDLNDLERMVELSRDLYERNVILRYKAIEQGVFKSPEVIQDEVFEKPQSAEIDFGIFENTPIETKVDEVVEERISFQMEDPEAIPLIESHPEIVQKPIIADVEEVNETVEKTEVSLDDVSEEWSHKIVNWGKNSEQGINQPISELSSSFGLNERLMYSNELFNSDTEAFNYLTKELDKLDSWTSAIGLLAQTASSKNWDAESDITEEFVVHVKRKYE
jgi:hypothetical protein